jgi:hypothetical protein
MTTQELARDVLAIDDLNAWLADTSDLAEAIYAASRADEGGEGAAWMQRCIQDNDARSLRLAASMLAA